LGIASLRWFKAAPALFLLGMATASPAQAIEELRLRLPLLQENLTARVSELANPDALWAGTSDLAELNRATNGQYARSIQELLNAPLPLQNDADSAMAQQGELLLRRLIDVDPGNHQQLASEPVLAGLKAAQAQAQGGKVTLLALLQAIPGESVTIRLDRALPFLQRMKAQQLVVDQLIPSFAKAGTAAAAQLKPGKFPIKTEVVSLAIEGQAEPLEVTMVRPVGAPSLAPVVLSHGLWSSPSSFLGWAQHLASHGAPVFLPRHAGSDINQQAAMLSGQAAPPDPEEFLRRPREVKAVLDGLEAGSFPGAEGIAPRNVVFIGHSWGATTALQLAGARSRSTDLWKSCTDPDHPKRNISWVLQCSFLSAAIPDSLADPRITRVVAVSPPQGLVFAAGLADLKVPVLVVSGSRDVVVPPQPEALSPFGQYPKAGSQLVLVEGGTHFNLPAAADSNGGPLRALLLRWVQGQPIDASSGLADPAGLSMRLPPRQ
jgi:predicted dienelactone hydrolase